MNYLISFFRKILAPVLFIPITAIILLSCKKDRIDVNKFWNCNNSQTLDSAGIAAKLSGLWLWSKKYSDIGGTKKADKVIKVTFNSNGTFSILENSNTITQGIWKLEIQYGTEYILSLNQPSEYLHGTILFCDNQVLFTSSRSDGDDNLFTKSN